ncbi:MAG: sigma-54-dependent Fis family transcriptional regulator [Planctomycetota bacterium]
MRELDNDKKFPQKKQQNSLQKLLETMKWMNQEKDIHSLLNYLLDTIIEISEAERGYVLYTPKQEKHFYVARHMEKQDLTDALYQFSQNVVQMVLKTGESVVSENALQDPLFSQFPSVRDFQLVSILCVPILSQKKAVGVLFVENRNISSLFTEASLKTVEAYAHQFALALRKSELIEENKEKATLLEVLNQKLEQKVLQQEIDLTEAARLIAEQNAELSKRYSFHQMIGHSPAIQFAFQRMIQCAKTDLPVLITGESGTGKELAAKAIHYSSPRNQKIFLAENCAGLSENVLESELFGHEKGAFTGAITTRKGLFELAHEGTLFLDEIGETSLNLQKKLLRVLQEGTFRRVGGEKVLQINVRIITATNKRLENLVQEGQFREDLFYRLSVLRVDMPPLREREEDIELLVPHFLQEIARKNQCAPKKISRTVLNYLRQKNWPGNIRQLFNYLQRLVAFTEGEMIDQIEAMEEIPSSSSGTLQIELKKFPEMLENLERMAIDFSLKKCNGNKTKAAELLGISRYTLLRKIQKIED